MARVDRGEDAEVASSAFESMTVSDGAAGRTPWAPPAEAELPVEPGAEPGKQAHADARRTLQELRAFYLHGQRPSAAGAEDDAAPLPALLHPYRDLSRVRHEFPVLLDSSKPAGAAKPLTDIVDEILASAPEGDEGARFRHSVLRLESIMRSLLEDREGDRLSLVWDRAAATLFETSRLSDDKAAALRENVAAARKALVADGDLISCGPAAPARIFRSCADAHWTECCGPWREELDTIIRQLQNILVADFVHSDEAVKPEHLRETLGAPEDVDERAMSSLLRSTPREGGLPEQRRERVRDTLATLKAMQPVFQSNRLPGKLDRAPIRFDQVFDDCASALEEHAKRMLAMTAFFKCVRVARLEIQNQYRDAVHDAFFSQFDERYLTRDEVALCPPVLVRVTDDALARGGQGALLDALNSRAGIKILLELRNICEVTGDSPRPRVSVGWPARIAGMAMALNHAYVMQAPASRAGVMSTRMLEGMRFTGPALFSIGVPEPQGRVLGSYLAAAAAVESRVHPVLAFDPSRGATLAERVDLGDNPQGERMWPTEKFTFRNAAGEETTIDLAFTPADFLFGDARLAGHFWTVPASSWHDAMAPLHQVLDLPVNEAAGRIPYILTVDRENRMARVVVSRDILDVSLRCRSYWSGLRESGRACSSRSASGSRPKETARSTRSRRTTSRSSSRTSVNSRARSWSASRTSSWGPAVR